MNPFYELFRLFYPERCPACGCLLPEGCRFLCPRCRWEMPLTGYSNQHDNPVAEKFWGLIPIQEATSMIFFSQHSRYRKMIHGFKYHGQWRICLKMGILFGSELHESGLYDTVDVIVPIPLHHRRLLQRGYNQAEYIARGMAQSLGKEVDAHSVVRNAHKHTQATTQNRAERWTNVAGIFSVRRPERLAEKHILLVDDVLTTGATIITCAETLLREVPSCRISIVTLAVSSYELFGSKGGL